MGEAANPEREPTFDELVAFAGELLTNRTPGFARPELARETVEHARDLWLLLYRVYHEDEPS